MLFTDFLGDIKFQYQIGWIIIILSLGSIFVNMVIAFKETVLALIQSVRKLTMRVIAYLQKRKLKKGTAYLDRGRAEEYKHRNA